MSNTAAELAALYLAESGRLQRRIARFIGCRTTAADLVQDLFLRMWSRHETATEEPSAYLMRSARNAAIDHLRRERIRLDYATGTVAEQRSGMVVPSPHDIVAARDQLRHIDDVIRGLPERTRHIFLLNRVHGREYKEIAGALGISMGAVEKHMMRALKAIRAAAQNF